MELLLRSTGEVVDLLQASGARVRAWKWTGSKDGVPIEVYVAGFNAPTLAAQAPEAATMHTTAVPPTDDL